MGFHEVLFPVDISYGSSGGPSFNNSIIELPSGQDEIVQRSTRARHRFDLVKGTNSYEKLTTIKAFYLARGGTANGWLLKDWTDYHSNPTDSSWHSSVGERDQLIGTGNGSTTTFTLRKTYSSGATSYVRLITKPVSSTVKIWVNGVLKTEGSDYTINYTTGVVTFATAPTNGHAVEASFEFNVPVRFERELDDLLAISMEDYGAGRISSIPAIEVLDPDPGYTGEVFHGGAYEISSAIDITVASGLGRVWVVSMTVTGKAVHLPDPATYPLGGPLFYIVNAGSNSFVVKNQGGTTILTLGANSAAEILLTEASGGSKVWYGI